MYDGIEIIAPKDKMKDFNRSALVSKKGIHFLGSQLKDSPHVKMTFTETEQGLKIHGSIGYALNGNSFESISTEDVKAFFTELSDKIGINLFEAEVRNFEAGVTVEVPFDFDVIEDTHLRPGKMDINDKPGRYKNFEDKKKIIKIYDAGKNLRFTKVSLETRAKLQEKGVYDPAKSYVKFEVKYKDPKKVFGLSSLTVNDLLKPDMIDKIKADVLETYESIPKKGYSVVDIKEGEWDANIILGIIAKEHEKLTGVSVSEAAQRSMDKYLKGNCKHGIKGTVKKAVAKIKATDSPTDISELLRKKLES